MSTNLDDFPSSVRLLHWDEAGVFNVTDTNNEIYSIELTVADQKAAIVFLSLKVIEIIGLVLI